jgi:carbon-monoxide dehydrogenase medium subunit
MKFPCFEYVCARSIEEATELLDRHGDDARLLAGGQSLLPMLAFRMSAPSVIIDISRISDLRFIRAREGIVKVGALTRYVDLERSDTIATNLPLVSRAIPEIAHMAIRNRGTLGGSIALADPAAQMPACMLALDAVMIVGGPEGERRIAAADFFTGTYETALRSNEILIQIEIPQPAENERIHFSQLSRRHGDFAIVGLAARCLRTEERLDDIRLVYFGCGDRPLRALRAESVLSREGATTKAMLADALMADLDPSTDLQATAEMRLHLAGVLLERAVPELLH